MFWLRNSITANRKKLKKKGYVISGKYTFSYAHIHYIKETYMRETKTTLTMITLTYSVKEEKTVLKTAHQTQRKIFEKENIYEEI